MADGDPPARFRIERHALPARGLRAGARPLRIAHLTDLHVRAVQPRHDRLAEVLDEWEPDLLFLTGDMVGQPRGGWDAMGTVLRRLQRPERTFACPGNWEVKSLTRPSRMKACLAEWGIDYLVNESRIVETHAGTVRICGIDDLCAGWPDFRATLRPIGPADYSVLLAHAPLTARFLTAEHGVDLVLSGHTHGGQIRVPLLWRRALPACHGDYDDGLHEEAWGHVYVNRGFGESAWLPFRFRCPAEAALLEVGGAA